MSPLFVRPVLTALLTVLSATPPALSVAPAPWAPSPQESAALQATTSTQFTVPDTVSDSAGSGTSQPVSQSPAHVPVTLVKPSGGLTAQLEILNSGASMGAGQVKVQLALQNTLSRAAQLAVTRDNAQDCALAPAVRVLRVRTRKVVYPVPGAAARLCAQDIKTDQLGAAGTSNGTVSYNRTLDLPAGEYMIEAWWSGLLDGKRVKVPAQSLRLTVK